MIAQFLTLLKIRFLFRNLYRLILEQSILKMVFISLFVLLLEGGLVLLFHDGFKFLAGLGETGNILIRHLFSFFFLGMSILLVISGIISSYAVLFRGNDLDFLLSSPIHISNIVLHKFLYGSLLASWAFYGIIIPFIVAFTIFSNDVWTLPLITVLFSLPFLVICAGVGAFIVMHIVRWLPSRKWLIFPTLFFIGAGVFYVWQKVGQTMGDNAADDQFSVAAMIPGFRLSENAFLPSHWLSEGIMAVAYGNFAEGMMFFAMLLSTALLVCLVIVETGKRIYFNAWQKTVISARKQGAGVWKYRLLETALGFIGKDTRALLLKDIRTFFRDPVQWSQALIFFGLLGFYFFNLQNFRYHQLSEVWRSLIILLNIFSVSAVICSLAARFIYPQMSLEGQAFWILGLAPVSIKKILFSKFFLALFAMLTASMILIVISAHMLNIGGYARFAAVILAGSIALSVCSLSTGLGAFFMDLTKRDPSAIVSSFGGTLNLICSLAVMLLIIFPFGIIFYNDAAGNFGAEMVQRAMIVATAWLAAITAVSTIIPLRLGYKALCSRDY